MRSERVDRAPEELLDPDAPMWSRIRAQRVPLQGTPIELIPSRYIRETKDRSRVGRVGEVEARSAHDGETIFFRLQWRDPTEDTDVSQVHLFSDAAGILFPLREDAPLITMGSREQPVNAWYWRADEERPFNVVAIGLGTTERTERSAIRARALWRSGAWRVVLGRPLRVPGQEDETVQMEPGARLRVGFAVWEGSHQERGGTKAFSGRWYPLEVAP